MTSAPSTCCTRPSGPRPNAATPCSRRPSRRCGGSAFAPGGSGRSPPPPSSCSTKNTAAPHDQRASRAVTGNGSVSGSADPCQVLWWDRAAYGHGELHDGEPVWHVRRSGCRHLAYRVHRSLFEGCQGHSFELLYRGHSCSLVEFDRMHVSDVCRIECGLLPWSLTFPPFSTPAGSCVSHSVRNLRPSLAWLLSWSRHRSVKPWSGFDSSSDRSLVRGVGGHPPELQ